MKDLIMPILFVALIVPVACVSCAFGVISAYRALEHSTYAMVVDGKEELRIRLYLGPFSYTIVVPEKVCTSGSEPKE